MTFSDYNAKYLKRKDRTFSYSTRPNYSRMIDDLYIEEGGVEIPILAKLSSGINLFRFGIGGAGADQERLSESGNFFPKDINFINLTTVPIPDIGVVSPTGPDSANYQYFETYEEPAVRNSSDTTRNNIAQRFKPFNTEEYPIAFRKNKDLGIRFKIPQVMNGVPIALTDTNVLCYSQRDYPLAGGTFRVKLVKVETITTLPLADPDRALGMEYEIMFKANDLHPADFFYLVKVSNPANPIINSWNDYASETAALNAISAAGNILNEDPGIITRVPDLRSNHPQGGGSFFPKRILLGFDHTAGGVYNLTYNAFTASAPGDPDRSYFYGDDNGNGTASKFVVFNPQMGEMEATVISGSTALNYSSVSCKLSENYMSYYLANKECPLHELGCSGVRSDTAYNIWMPAGILSSRYMYQTDWNEQTVSSGHFADVTVSCAWAYTTHATDFPYPGPPSPTSAYFWRPVIIMEDLGSNARIPKDNMILPCNHRANSLDPDKYDPFRANFPYQAKAENFKWIGVKGAGRASQKFFFIENCRASASQVPQTVPPALPDPNANTYETEWQNNTTGPVSSAWCDNEAKNYGFNYPPGTPTGGPFNPSPTMNKKYTLSYRNPKTVGGNPDGIEPGRNNALGTGGSGDFYFPTTAGPLVLRRRVFIKPDGFGWPRSDPAAVAQVDMTGENFSIAYMHYHPGYRKTRGTRLFDVYSVDDEKNTLINDFGNQFLIIGVAKGIIDDIGASPEGTGRAFRQYNIVVGNYYQTQYYPIDPIPGDSTRLVNQMAKITLYDRLGRRAPHMGVYMHLPSHPYWTLKAKHVYSGINSFTGGTVFLYANENGEIGDLYYWAQLNQTFTPNTGNPPTPGYHIGGPTIQDPHPWKPCLPSNFYYPNCPSFWPKEHLILFSLEGAGYFGGKGATIPDRHAVFNEPGNLTVAIGVGGVWADSSWDNGIPNQLRNFSISNLAVGKQGCTKVDAFSPNIGTNYSNSILVTVKGQLDTIGEGVIVRVETSRIGSGFEARYWAYSPVLDSLTGFARPPLGPGVGTNFGDFVDVFLFNNGFTIDIKVMDTIPPDPNASGFIGLNVYSYDDTNGLKVRLNTEPWGVWIYGSTTCSNLPN